MGTFIEIMRFVKVFYSWKDGGMHVKSTCIEGQHQKMIGKEKKMTFNPVFVKIRQ